LGSHFQNAWLGHPTSRLLVFTKFVRIRTCRGEKSGRKAEHHGHAGPTWGNKHGFKVSVTKTANFDSKEFHSYAGIDVFHRLRSHDLGTDGKPPIHRVQTALLDAG